MDAQLDALEEELLQKKDLDKPQSANNDLCIRGSLFSGGVISILVGGACLEYSKKSNVLFTLGISGLALGMFFLAISCNWPDKSTKDDSVNNTEQNPSPV